MGVVADDHSISDASPTMDSVPALIALYTTTLPLLIAAVLSFCATLMSFSFQYRRDADKRLLLSYRVTLLFSGLLLVVYSGVYNHWADGTLLTRLSLAGVSLLGALIITFRSGFQRKPIPAGIVESISVVTALVLAAWVVIDPHSLVRNGMANPQGFLRIEAGGSFAAYVFLTLGGICTSLSYVYSQARGGAKRQARRFVGVGGVIVAAVGIDVTSAVLNFNLPPLAWVGTAALIYAFLCDATENYRAAMRTWRQTLDQRDDLYQKLIRDPLTGLSTRTYGLDALEKTLKTSTACVIFLDLDHFKTWNDRFGHAAGDRVLTEVANTIKHSARMGDVCARYAGDEFFVVLQDAKLSQGLEVAQAILEGLAQIDFQVELPITGSIGVTFVKRGENADRAINRADELAYKAKHGGKNRVVSDAAFSAAA
jgi:diguanylate cyclase (GGDEF)-like protein